MDNLRLRSAGGPAHSKTLRAALSTNEFRQILDCGGPPPLLQAAKSNFLNCDSPVYLFPNRSSNFPCIPPKPPLLNTQTMSPP